MQPLDQLIKQKLSEHLDNLEKMMNSDFMAIISPLIYGIDNLLRMAIELNHSKRNSLTIILDTPGGIVEVAERMVNTIRFHYKEVIFIVPDRAMSAGTVFVMSGDRIMMDYFSCLGPIDPQIEKEGKLVPALSYLNQFNRLNEKAKEGNLTTAEYALLSKLDLGELHQFEQARELSIDLLRKWLSTYKFKNWTKTETSGAPVTTQTKEKRAKEIADVLSDNEKWHSHGRGINMETLRKELKLKIDDIGENPVFSSKVKDYFELLRNYMIRNSIYSFVHTKECF
ncbi:MAG: ATP-dependent Clp protease proteolytic subunit [Candidatus Sumerlaeota bacterium]|nr:ATP-dependent Clp protease proteolytic subunit [Candidatus Sumerlaeota bacterium]